jgi:hypothetical protein
VDAQLIVNVIMTKEVDGDGGTDYRVCTGMEKEELCLLSSQVLHLRCELADSHDEAARREHSTKNSISRLIKNVARLAITPGRQTVADEEVDEDDESESGGARLAAVLLPRPRTVHDLWK